MTPVTHQLNPAPRSFEKTFSDKRVFRVHCEQDGNGKLKLDEYGDAIPRLNSKGRRKLEALQRRGIVRRELV